jgi:hypothetical protein
MNSTRCKFECTDIKDTSSPGLPSASVTLQARYCPEVPDDVRFSKYTPWGEMKVGISNPDAIPMFEVGKQYHIDISLVQA